jgi:hypothetical protein
LGARPETAVPKLRQPMLGEEGRGTVETGVRAGPSAAAAGCLVEGSVRVAKKHDPATWCTWFVGGWL